MKEGKEGEEGEEGNRISEFGGTQNVLTAKKVAILHKINSIVREGGLCLCSRDF
ncbi:hypothetical protein [Kamptonema sp. UHCC 0994]|uniref:hypothetical protein n=1 Tax=Kamptonema sp. UHCC 0994 TaxID=3031329 RepID=UPI0023BB1610|nr:hypothetical protein [Kamptonema sp. UHCC 0994]MDF0557066.1 hypothetical protein [Kamptonema sp. UHCC 0994]